MLKALANENVKIFECGLGYYDYKMKLGAKLGKTFIYRFVADNLISLIKHRIFATERKIASIIYHRLWYRRVQSFLPDYLKKPIAQRWIKLDF